MTAPNVCLVMSCRYLVSTVRSDAAGFGAERSDAVWRILRPTCSFRPRINLRISRLLSSNPFLPLTCQFASNLEANSPSHPELVFHHHHSTLCANRKYLALRHTRVEMKPCYPTLREDFGVLLSSGIGYAARKQHIQVMYHTIAMNSKAFVAIEDNLIISDADCYNQIGHAQRFPFFELN